MNSCEYPDVGGPQLEARKLVLESVFNKASIIVLQVPGCIDALREEVKTLLRALADGAWGGVGHYDPRLSTDIGVVNL